MSELTINTSRLLDLRGMKSHEGISFGLKILTHDNKFLMERRDYFAGLFHGALYLSEGFDWVLVRDKQDVLCLVPLRKDTGE